MSSRPSESSFLPVRSAVVLLTAVVVALVAGALGVLAHQDLPAALLLAGGAGGTALALTHRLLDRR